MQTLGDTDSLIVQTASRTYETFVQVIASQDLDALVIIFFLVLAKQRDV